MEERHDEQCAVRLAEVVRVDNVARRGEEVVVRQRDAFRASGRP